MAVKTFTSGEVLTASDTNTYLANSGLVYITSTTVGTAVTSVAVNNCFSSTYDNYRITYAGGTCTATTSLSIQLGSSTASYYSSFPYTSWTSSSGGSVLPNNNAANWKYVGAGDPDQTLLCIDLFSPNLAKHTRFMGTYVRDDIGGPVYGHHEVATAYTGFTMIVDFVGTITGGIITVYGYRKA